MERSPRCIVKKKQVTGVDDPSAYFKSICMLVYLHTHTKFLGEYISVDSDLVQGM